MRYPLAGRSLRWRLTLAGAGAIVIAILGAALGLALLFERHVERTIEGSLIRRNGSADDPAFLIETDNGGQVLKLRSEIDAA